MKTLFFLLIMIQFSFSDLIDELQRLEVDASPLHQKFTESDWSSLHPTEKGISFENYKIKCSVKPKRDPQKKFYIVPLDKKIETDQTLILLIQNALASFFKTTVAIGSMENSAMNLVPKRINPYSKQEQLNADSIIVLIHDDQPEDTDFALGLTSHDLWLGDNSNFLFGLASLEQRTGVWSTSRLKDSDPQKEKSRILRIALHEAGHMHHLPHCIDYMCLMNGSNSLQESDRQPFRFCPKCLKKLLWNLQVSPKDWCKGIIEFYKKHPLSDELEYYEKLNQLL